LYTGSQLAPNSMTLDDIECQNRGFINFWRFRAARHISRANCTKINWDKTWTSCNMKFSALNIDFDGPSFNFLGYKNLRMRASKSSTPVKVIILPLLASLSWKWLKVDNGHMLPITASTSDKLFSCINTSITLKDPELPK